MFDEPIKIGLIRFADAYDHYLDYKQATSAGDQFGPAPLAHIGSGQSRLAPRAPSPATQSPSEDERRHIEAMHNFDSSHQPLLVIYTNAVQIEAP